MTGQPEESPTAQLPELPELSEDELDSVTGPSDSPDAVTSA